MVLIYEGYVALRDAQAGWNAFAVFQATRCARGRVTSLAWLYNYTEHRTHTGASCMSGFLGAEQKTVRKAG